MHLHWRTRYALSRFGPAALMLGSLALVVGAMLRSRGATVPGYAEVAVVRVASLEAGVVSSVDVVPGQLVGAGEVLARLDAGPIHARMRVLQARRDQQVAALADSEDAARSDIGEARIAASSAQVALERSRAELSARHAELAAAQDRLALGLVTRDALEPLRRSVLTLEAEVPARERAAAAQRAQVQRLSSRLGAGDAVDAPPAVLEQVGALAVLEEELRALQERLEARTLKAPLAARVAGVHRTPGEILPAQESFIELLPLQTSTVVACLPEQFVGGVRAGARVQLWPESGQEGLSGVVVDIAGLVEAAPDRCKQRPNEVGWVRPLRVAVAESQLVPGQRFAVGFEGQP